MIADDLYKVGDNETLQSGSGSCLSADFMDGNSIRSIQSNETLLISTDDEMVNFFDDENATLQSDTSSHILEKAFESDEIEYKNPIYNDFDYNFSLTDFDSNVLNNVMKYSLNKQDGDNNHNDEKIEEESNIDDLDYRLERPILWSDFINYYWIGLFNNLKHKRNYVEYCNQVMNFKKKINIISQGINITNTEEKEKEKINYFNIENYDVNSYDSKNLFTISESNKILTEIEELFNMIDKLLIDDIIFMKNAKAPIGDFLHRYNSIKNNCLKLSNIKNNKIFNHARCSTEIKQYKNSKSIKKIKDKFDKDATDKVKKEFEEKFKDDLLKDKEYIEKDKFLYSLKEWMINVILEEKEQEKEENYEMIFNYQNRQTLYIIFISIIYAVYCNVRSTYSKVGLLHNEKLNENDLNLIEKNINFASSILVKEIDFFRSLSTKEKKQQGRESLNLFKYSFINKNEYVINEVSGPMVHDIAVNSCYWTYQNTKMVKDIYKLVDYLNELNMQKGELKIITEFIKTINDHLRKLMKEENKFKATISNWYEEKENEKKLLYKSNIFSEKEVWWYYFVYNSNIYYSNDRINNENCCCYPNKENNDMEEGTLINNEEEKPDEINIFLETNSYLYHVINKDRPKYPLHKDFKWDKLDFNKDKIEFSKRQLRYNKYFIEKLNNELINNELKQINDLNESLVRKNFILDCIENIEEVLNELENMSNFIKEGVLLNEQLFFKLVLFGINILIFIGQYFWNNHIKPSM